MSTKFCLRHGPCPPAPGHTAHQPHRCRSSGCGPGGLVSAPPPPQAAASAQASSSLTRVRAAVAPPEEILSFAQAPGDAELPRTAGRGRLMGTLGCSPTPAGPGWLDFVSEVGSRAGAAPQGPRPGTCTSGFRDSPPSHRGDLGHGVCASTPGWRPLPSQDCPGPPPNSGREQAP